MNSSGRGFDFEFLKHVNPTLVLAACLYSFYFIFLFSTFLFYKLPFYAYIPLGILQTFIVFLMFTVLHDGVHFTISKKHWLNELSFLSTWLVFLNNPYLFRRIHLQHHAHVNQARKDPDHFTSSRFLLFRFLKSFLLVFYYPWFAFREYRCWKWRAHIVASIALPPLLLNLALVTPFTWPILIVWLLPTFFGVGLLAYANTALPHHPGREDSRYRNSSNIYVPWLAQALMLNQNLHLVHHLKPKLPWYEYPEYWKQHQGEILKNGARVLVYTKRREPYVLIPQVVFQQIERIRDRISIYHPW